MIRSYLFVPGDSERKLAKSLTGSADALILDLEDAVAPSNKDAGREMTSNFVRAAPADTRSKLWVRVNAFSTGLTERDIGAIVPARPAGIVLPKCDGIEDVERVDVLLSSLETKSGLGARSIRLMGIVTETASSVLNLPSLRRGHPRLASMMWGAEDLATDLGASGNRESGGVTFMEPFRVARSLCLMAAKAAGVDAIDTVYTDIRNLAGLEDETRAGRGMGFNARAAIHPDQVAVINAVYTPSADEMAWARRIIAAFDANPGAGVVRLDDKMVDQPHLKHARRLLGL